MKSSVELTQDLVRFNTINPPGAERACAETLAALLEGCRVSRSTLVPFGEGRAQLVARIGGCPGKLPLGFTGHLDTVPLGAQPWSVDPLCRRDCGRQALRPRLVGHEKRRRRVRLSLHCN